MDRTDGAVLSSPDAAGPATRILRSAFYGPEVIGELNSEALKRDNWRAVIDVANEFNKMVEAATNRSVVQGK